MAISYGNTAPDGFLYRKLNGTLFESMYFHLFSVVFSQRSRRLNPRPSTGSALPVSLPLPLPAHTMPLSRRETDGRTDLWKAGKRAGETVSITGCMRAETKGVGQTIPAVTNENTLTRRHCAARVNGVLLHAVLYAPCLHQLPY